MKKEVGSVCEECIEGSSFDATSDRSLSKHSKNSTTPVLTPESLKKKQFRTTI
jgi:hypothetical protein